MYMTNHLKQYLATLSSKSHAHFSYVLILYSVISCCSMHLLSYTSLRCVFCILVMLSLPGIQVYNLYANIFSDCHHIKMSQIQPWRQLNISPILVVITFQLILLKSLSPKSHS